MRRKPYNKLLENGTGILLVPCARWVGKSCIAEALSKMEYKFSY